jgi:hypothetical protein
MGRVWGFGLPMKAVMRVIALAEWPGFDSHCGLARQGRDGSRYTAVRDLTLNWHRFLPSLLRPCFLRLAGQRVLFGVNYSSL